MTTTPGQSSASAPRQATPVAVPEGTTPTTTSSGGPQAGGTTNTTQSATGGSAAAAAASTTTTTAAPAVTPAAAASTATPAPASTEARPATETPTAGASATTSSAPPPPAPVQETFTAPSDVLPPSHWTQVQHEEEEDLDDVDSAYGDDNASSTASLSASILEYRTVHGRTYHSERGNAQSWGPNDAKHDESMDILHHVSTLMQDGKITLAHIDDDIQKVLDVGCGTGIWAIDFADQYPHTEVIGVDLSPSQPQWIPPNLKFEIDDATLPWTYGPDAFDYIHMRWLVGAIPDWYALFREVFRALKPGGIFESKESSCIIRSDDGTVPYGCALDQWGRVFTEAGKKFGRTFRVVEDGLQRKAMEAAGFVDIKEYDLRTIIGPWPADPKYKEIGQYSRLALEQDIEGFIMYMWTTILGWSREEIAVYAAHLRRELRSPNYHAYYPMKVVIGRKPL